MKLTDRGRRTALLAVALWGAAFLSGSPAASVAASVLTLALALALATLPRPRVRAQRHVARERFGEGERVETQLEVDLLQPLRATVDLVEETTPGLEPEGERTVRATLRKGAPFTVPLAFRAETWGRKRLGPLRVVVRDALGLLEAETVAEGERLLRVQPSAQPLGRWSPRPRNPEPALGAHTVPKPGEAMDFFALREYRSGDSIRSVNWRATARSGGKMIVNQMTRDSFARVVVLVDLRDKETLDDAPETALIRNGRAAAGVLGLHDRLKDHVTLLGLGREAAKLTTASNPRLPDLLDGLANHEQGGDGDMEQALRANLRYIRPRSPVYLVTSGALDPSLSAAVRVALALNALPYVVATELGPLTDLSEEDAAYVRKTREDALRAVRSAGVPVLEWKRGQTLEVAASALA